MVSCRCAGNAVVWPVWLAAGAAVRCSLWWWRILSCVLVAVWVAGAAVRPSVEWWACQVDVRSVWSSAWCVGGRAGRGSGGMSVRCAGRWLVGLFGRRVACRSGGVPGSVSVSGIGCGSGSRTVSPSAPR